MLEIVEAPNLTVENNPIKVFLAGGITNCPDWQKDVIDYFRTRRNPKVKLLLENVTVYNPRRENFPIEDPSASEEQITWEYDRLRESNLLAFWFSRGSLNPIVLYEYGRHGISQPVELVVGVDPEYERKFDVTFQTKLAKPILRVWDNIDEFKYHLMEAIYNMSVAKKLIK